MCAIRFYFWTRANCIFLSRWFCASIFEKIQRNTVSNIRASLLSELCAMKFGGFNRKWKLSKFERETCSQWIKKLWETREKRREKEFFMYFFFHMKPTYSFPRFPTMSMIWHTTSHIYIPSLNSFICIASQLHNNAR